MRSVLFLVPFFLLFILDGASVFARPKIVKTTGRIFTFLNPDECQKKMTVRKFEWSTRCIDKVEKGFMDHYEIDRNGKCVRLVSAVTRKCPRHCPDRKEKQEFCKSQKGSRMIKIIYYKRDKKTGKCVKQKKFKTEACARFIPWIHCPEHKRMEVGVCKSNGLRAVLVKRYVRVDNKAMECKNTKLKKIYEKCDYKKQQKKKNKKNKKNKKAKTPKK